MSRILGAVHSSNILSHSIKTLTDLLELKVTYNSMQYIELKIPQCAQITYFQVKEV